MAKPGSAFCASRNASFASSYSKLCMSSTPFRNAGCAAAAPEVWKSILPSSSWARSGPVEAAIIKAATKRAAGRVMVEIYRYKKKGASPKTRPFPSASIRKPQASSRGLVTLN